VVTREDWAKDKAAFLIDEPKATTSGPLVRHELLTKRLLNATAVTDVLLAVTLSNSSSPTCSGALNIYSSSAGALDPHGRAAGVDNEDGP
jgi:hypothetical protein